MSRHSAPSAGPASITASPAHHDTVLPATFRADGADVGQLGCAQGAEEAGLAVFVAREEAVISDHQAAGDAGAGRHPLGDDLEGIDRGAGRSKLYLLGLVSIRTPRARGPASPLPPPPEVRQAPPISGVQVRMK